ncbi:glycoside hydrolase family 11 protein [Trichoderma sp. SZMC 28012]
MVAFSRFVAGLSVIAASLAAPTEVAEKKVEERGEYNFFLGPDHPLSRRNLAGRSNTNYNQDYTTGGTVNFTPSTNGFSLNWNTQEDFVVGVGWNPGSNLPITHSGTFNVASGLGSLSVYGWTTNPLVEYYVMETNIGISTGGSQKGTVTSDGGTYAIWENQRVNEPSIIGTATFNQYISIRQGGRSNGTVTIQNHFDAWAAAGLHLGTMNYQVIAVESWSGSGSAQQSVSNTGGSGTPPPPPPGSTTSSAPGSGPTGSCSALYGQCGGIGWQGPTCCSSGTCKVGNAYYSQCL